MTTKLMTTIFDQIDNLKIPSNEEQKVKADNVEADSVDQSLRVLLVSLSDEIQRVMDQNNFTQEDLCRITGMSQSNISKIQNGKVTPRIETLQRIANATHTRLVIGFENTEGEE